MVWQELVEKQSVMCQMNIVWNINPSEPDVVVISLLIMVSLASETYKIISMRYDSYVLMMNWWYKTLDYGTILPRFVSFYSSTLQYWNRKTYIYLCPCNAYNYVGSHKHSGRRASTHNAKDADGSLNLNEGKPSKRGVSSGYVSHEVCNRLKPISYS